MIPAIGLTTAFYAALSGDATLVAALAKYGGANRPAIFTSRPVPKDAVFPWVATATVAATPDDSSDGLMADVVQDVYVYGRAADGPKKVLEIADRVVGLFHRPGHSRAAAWVATLGVSGWTTVIQEVQGGPQEVPTDETVIGRLVTVRALITKD